MKYQKNIPTKQLRYQICHWDERAKRYEMKNELNKKKELAMRNIFRHMMENGYDPVYQDSYIMFDMDDNTSVLEYDGEILSIRTFFTIDEEEYDMFLEASNYAMINTKMIKPVIMENMTNIMFSCETLCDNMADVKRFLPKMVKLSKEGLKAHKNEMRELLQTTNIMSQKMPASEDSFFETGRSPRGKLLS